jgi:hypothetical protein
MTCFYGFSQPHQFKYGVKALKWNTSTEFRINFTLSYVTTRSLCTNVSDAVRSVVKQRNNLSVTDGTVLLIKWSTKANKIRRYKCLLETALLLFPVTYSHNHFGVRQMKLVISRVYHFSRRVSFSVCNNVPSVLFLACMFGQ